MIHHKYLDSKELIHDKDDTYSTFLYTEIHLDMSSPFLKSKISYYFRLMMSKLLTDTDYFVNLFMKRKEIKIYINESTFSHHDTIYFTSDEEEFNEFLCENIYPDEDF